MPTAICRDIKDMTEGNTGADFIFFEFVYPLFNSLVFKE